MASSGPECVCVVYLSLDFGLVFIIISRRASFHPECLVHQNNQYYFKKVKTSLESFGGVVQKNKDSSAVKERLAVVTTPINSFDKK